MSPNRSRSRHHRSRGKSFPRRALTLLAGTLALLLAAGWAIRVDASTALRSMAGEKAPVSGDKAGLPPITTPAPTRMGAPASPYLGTAARFRTAPEAYGDGTSLLLVNGYRFDPLREGEPVVAAGLRAAAVREGETGSYLVQLRGPVEAGEREAIERAGAAIFSYIPNYTFLVRMTPATAALVQALPSVRWLGPHHPAYKLSPDREMAKAAGPKPLVILLFPDAEIDQVAADVTSRGGEIVEKSDSGRNKILRVTIDVARLGDLAALNAVAWIEPWRQIELDNSDDQWVVQTNVSQSRRVWDHGIRGQGQIVHTLDSGVRTSHNMFRDDSVPITTWGQFPTHRKVIAYLPSVEDGVLFGDAAGASYHGTHTAGTVLGNDAPFALDLRDGMAPEAKLYFTDGGADANTIIAPADLNLVFAAPYAGNAGGAARITSNSWGAPVSGAYTVLSLTADQFMWDHKDFLAFFSTGNDGTPGSVGSPASCKNGVGSGATANGLAAGAMMPLTSQGPTADGRTKPTILAPGLQLSSANGANDTGYQALTGTSMSCPSKAGATALIRQYLMEGWYPTGEATPANAFVPSGALLKAMAIASTDNDMPGLPIPNNVAGWGRIKVDNILFFKGSGLTPDDSARTALVDDPSGLATGEAVEYEVHVANTAVPLKIALCWFDKEGSPTAARQIVNDLDLTVIDPLNVTYLGNAMAGGESVPAGLRDTLNVEECFRKIAPMAGTWKIRISGTNVPYSPQPFALVISAGLDSGAGLVRVDQTSYGQNETIAVRVEDLNAGGPVSVSISSATEPTAEVISLSGGSGVFAGTIPTTLQEASPNDGVLSVSSGDTIAVEYADANPVGTSRATAIADFAGPIVTTVSAEAADVSATIRWSTDGAATSQVHFGLTPSLGQSSSLDPNLVAQHAVSLSGLETESIYYFDVESADRGGNATRDDAGGNHYRFTTGKTGEILLVIGDGSFTGESQYLDAFASFGWDASVLAGGTIATPLVGDKTAGLRSYAAVWWQVGSEQYPPFEDSAQESLTKYIDGGGRLSVVSHDVAWAFSEPTSGFHTAARQAWLESKLHVHWLEDPATWPAILGYAGDPISNDYATGLVYSPLRAGGSGDEVSIVAGSGTGNYVWQNTDTSPDNIAVRWEDGAPNGSADSAAWGGTPTRIVTNCLEWTSIVDAAGKAGVLDKTLQWLIGRDHPDAAVTSPNGGEVEAGGTLSIAWTEAPDSLRTIASRAIYYSPDAGATWSLVSAAPGASPYSWDLAGLDNGAEYRVRVVVRDDGSPSLSGSDVSDANFTIDRPGGDTRGPVVVAGSIASDPNPIDNREESTLSASVTDVGYGGSAVAAAEWSRGAAPAPAGSGYPMSGAFSSATVSASGTIAEHSVPTGSQTFWVRGRDAAGNWGNATAATIFVNGDDQVAVEGGVRPIAFALEQNQPNPFNPSTWIRYALPKPCDVQLVVYNASGQRVRILEAGRREAGLQSVHWDGRNDAGAPVASGVYVYRLDAEQFGASRKMVLVK